MLPLVCKRWAALLRKASPRLWHNVILEPALDQREAPGFRQVGNWVKLRAAVRTRN